MVIIIYIMNIYIKFSKIVSLFLSLSTISWPRTYNIIHAVPVLTVVILPQLLEC